MITKRFNMDFNHLNLAIREMRDSDPINIPKFILWLIHDRDFGLINYHDKNDIEPYIPLYEEWIDTKAKPKKMIDDLKITVYNKIRVHNLSQALSLGATSWLFLEGIRARAKSGDHRYTAREIEKIFFNKMKELIKENEVFTWEDYEKA